MIRSHCGGMFLHKHKLIELSNKTTTKIQYLSSRCRSEMTAAYNTTNSAQAISRLSIGFQVSIYSTSAAAVVVVAAAA